MAEHLQLMQTSIIQGTAYVPQTKTDSLPACLPARPPPPPKKKVGKAVGRYVHMAPCFACQGHMIDGTCTLTQAIHY